MSTLIVAFPKIEEAKAVRSLLVRRGYDVAVPCTSGAQAINQADNLSDGIIICGYKLSDNMLYSELYEYKPKSFEILLVASQNLWEECHDSNVVCVAMPIKVNDLLSTIEIMQQSQIRRRRKARTTPRQRSPMNPNIRSVQITNISSGAIIVPKHPCSIWNLPCPPTRAAATLRPRRT